MSLTRSERMKIEKPCVGQPLLGPAKKIIIYSMTKDCIPNHLGVIENHGQLDRQTDKGT